jgi:hypothetical protein
MNLNTSVMENENQGLNQHDKLWEKSNPRVKDQSESTTGQASDKLVDPESGNWPKDETLEEYIEKDQANVKMKPGHLNKE